MNYYCINLKSAENRKRHIQKQADAASIKVIFIDAVEGENLDVCNVPSYNRDKRLRYMQEMGPNEVACCLSHRLALEAFLSDPHPFGVVLEDDALFDTSIDSAIQRLVANIEGFDIFKLESRDSKGRVVAGGGKSRRIFLPLKASNGATAILYTKSGARKILETLTHFHVPFDTLLGFSWKADVLCIACWPPLIKEDRCYPSTIGGCTESQRVCGVYPWLVARHERVTHSIMKRLYFFRVKSAIKINKNFVQ